VSVRHGLPQEVEGETKLRERREAGGHQKRTGSVGGSVNFKGWSALDRVVVPTALRGDIPDTHFLLRRS
jgi:hypothetical protein